MQDGLHSVKYVNFHQLEPIQYLVGSIVSVYNNKIVFLESSQNYKGFLH